VVKGKPSRQPIEGLFKIAAGAVGIIRATIFVVLSDQEDGLPHLPIPVLVVASGVVDFLRHRKWPLHAGFEALIGVLYHGVFLVVIYSHLDPEAHVRSPANVRVHSHLAQLLALAVVAIVAEAGHSGIPGYAFARAYAVLCVGTWIIHIGYFLFWPFSDVRDQFIDQSHRQMTRILVAFTSHLMGNYYGDSSLKQNLAGKSVDS